LNLGVPLGLGSGLCWGAADFFGGVQSRHLPALTVAFWSQVAGAAALAAALAIDGTPPNATGFAWGLAAGIGGGCALTLFYRGLAEGTMSIVAPISACGAIVPVAAALLTGNQPGTLAALGVLIAITGIVLVSRPIPTPAAPGNPANPGNPATPGNPASPGAPGIPGAGPANPGAFANRGRSGRVVAMALGAALGFGLFYVFVDAGTTGSHAAPLWVIAGARTSSLAILSTIALVGQRSWRDRRGRWSALRWPGRRIGAGALVGIGDTGANLLFAYAAIGGNLAVVGVLGSLYPVATVVLARWLLGERLSGGQNAGVVLALTGVGLLAAA
jgi:drug/metabolite transporter (DMT)-like permease